MIGDYSFDHPLTEGDREWAKKVNMEILREFFLTPYDAGRDFYGQFYERLREAKERAAFYR